MKSKLEGLGCITTHTGPAKIIPLNNTEYDSRSEMFQWRCKSSYYDHKDMIVLFNYQMIPCNESNATA